MEPIRGLITHVFPRKENAEGKVTSQFVVIRYEGATGMVDAKMSTRSLDLNLGDYFYAEGEWKTRSFKGREEETFNAKVARPDLPRSVTGTSKWFATIFTPEKHGVTAASIKAFLDKHGAAAAALCEKNPDLIAGLSTNPTAFRNAIVADWGRRISGRQAVTLMERCGLEPKIIAAVLEALRDTAGATLLQNPYLIAKVKDVKFADADLVGTHMGITPEDSRRVSAAMIDCLESVRGEGHTYLGLSDIGQRMEETYGISLVTASGYVVSQLNVKDSPIRVSTREGSLIAQLREFLNGEEFIAESIGRRLRVGQRHNQAAVDAVVAGLFAQEKFARFDSVQRGAVAVAAREPLCIVTGGPGTGKSTVSEVIVMAASKLDTGPILLAAPTGKAAKRLEETTGRPAATIHSLLGAREEAATGTTYFTKNSKNQLPSKCVVLVDEASMIDITTMQALLRAIPMDGRLILVGDRNQLPSVDAGAVLGDMIKARLGEFQIVPQAELVNVYRQSRDSAIATGAALVREGVLPVMTNKFVGGLAMFEHEGEDILKRVKWLVENSLRLRWRPQDISVLVPQRTETAGAHEINTMMQQLLNPKGPPIPGAFRPPAERPAPGQRAKKPDLSPIPRVGDRVMMSENDSKNEVMNGDIGVITEAYAKKTGSGAERNFIRIKLDSGKEVEYPASKWRSLSLAYAITIHKSQGSQYPVVIMPVTLAHAKMLDRSLLYTGWTRAKDALFLVGEREALQISVESTEMSRRDTRLREFLAGAALRYDLPNHMPPPPVIELPPAPAPAEPDPGPTDPDAVLAEAVEEDARDEEAPPAAPIRPRLPVRPPGRPIPVVETYAGGDDEGPDADGTVAEAVESAPVRSVVPRVAVRPRPGVVALPPVRPALPTVRAMPQAARAMPAQSYPEPEPEPDPAPVAVARIVPRLPPRLPPRVRPAPPPMPEPEAEADAPAPGMAF